MLRGLTIVALGLAGALLLPAESEAAGRSGVPMMAAGPSAGPVLARSHNTMGSRGFGHRAGRVARFHGRGFIGGPLLPFSDAPQIAILREAEPEPEKPVDRNSFAYLPARTGIPYPPTPDPILIRLEGRRDRPVSRVIRIAGAESGKGPRSRFAHAPTGALLLTVPGR
ncbi:hypothetical protein [Bosea sp. PAMC 26642]|uniref:hypothetical protein n=1 Tax=Bosea sp. (strain PAMC 26642) TaxID=1792307 RepID=UPI0012E96FE3|nr:hypothetical protein [Bosea sp. PAMC 26642]